MFTGIVAALGQIESVTPLGDDTHGVRLSIAAGQLDLSDVSPGDSIAVQGACMTVVRLAEQTFEVDVSRESLEKTVGLDSTGLVNLEKAMRLSDRIGGHLVSGHVDGLGVVTRFELRGESWLLQVLSPGVLGRYLAYKGSVTINGVSLTVNSVSDADAGTTIEMNLIPHTVEVTTLKTLSVDDRVNLEIDLIARYVERMAAART
ncbi:MAG: riboflavin synthase [Burkholderiaceae bacterium]